MEKFKDLVLKNRTYRGYDEIFTISKEELIDLVDHARLMPNAKNHQVLKYFVAHEKNVVSQIQAHTKWAGSLRELGLPFEGTRPTAFIVVLQDTELNPTLASGQKDVGIAAAYITLAAAEKGLGCCMIGNYSAVGVKEVMNLPEHLTPVLVIAVGKPMEEVVLVEPVEGSITYYRNEENVHYVPKRTIEEIVVNQD